MALTQEREKDRGEHREHEDGHEQSRSRDQGPRKERGVKSTDTEHAREVHANAENEPLPFFPQGFSGGSRSRGKRESGEERVEGDRVADVEDSRVERELSRYENLPRDLPAADRMSPACSSSMVHTQDDPEGE